MIQWWKDLGKWLFYYRWRIWGGTWRAAVFLLASMAIHYKWLSLFQMLCLSGIFFLMGYALLHWTDNKDDEE